MSERPLPLDHPSTPSAGLHNQDPPVIVGALALRLPAALLWQIVYLLTGAAVLLLQAEAGPSFWYPPVALGLVLLCLYGWRAAPIVLLGDLVISLIQYRSGLAGLIVATNTLLEVGLAAALLARARVNLRLPDNASLLRLLLLGTIIPTLIGATHGSLWLLGLGSTAPDVAVGAWLTWWLGDTVTTLCLLPALLLWVFPICAGEIERPRDVLPLRSPEGVLLVTVVAALCVAAFGWGGDNRAHLGRSLQYLCLLPALWAGIRFGVRAASLVIALTSTLAVVISLLAGSPAGLTNIQQTPIVLDIQLFMLALALGGLILALGLEGERRALATSRRDAEALAASEARLRRILQEMPVALNAFDADGRCVLLNAEAERVMGYRADEIVGNPGAWELLYPDHAYRERMLHAWALHGNNYRDWEWQLTRKDGEVRTIAWSNISTQVPIAGWATWGIGVDVTERRRAEAALREREELFRQLAESVREVFWVRDIASGRIVYVNPGYAEVWGRPCEELAARPESFLDSVHPDDRSRVMAAMARQRDGLLFDETYRIIRGDGEQRWVWARTFPVTDAAGVIYRRVGVAEDVTERVQAEEGLRRRNRELALLNRVIAASAATVEPAAILDTVCRELALSFDAPLAFAAAPLLPGGPTRLLAAYPGANAATPTEEEIEALVTLVHTQSGPALSPDGQQLALPLAVGEGVAGVICLCAAARPWTPEAIQLAESVTRQTAGALARAQITQAHQLLSVAQEQAGESTVITDADGNILAVNPAFERMSGYHQEEVLGKNPRILKSGVQDSAYYENLWATLTRGEVWRGRLVNRHKNGRHYTEDTTIAPIQGANGITHYVAVKRDVTRELELEAQFQQAQKMEAVGRLAGGIAHDFNNLLSVINGYSEFLLEAHPDHDDPARHDIETIRQAGERAAGLTRQLLAFSRRQTLMPQVVSLNEVLAETEKLLRRLIGEDVAVVVRPAANLWPVYVDRGQLEQVVMNLAVNARDAMPSGGRLTFTTGNVPEAASGMSVVRLEVEDTGIGMSPETLEHLFEPFFTTKERGRGTGLGLATVHGIVTQSGGTIQVQSAPGHGTRFTVELPRHQDDGREEVLAPEPTPLPRGAGTILLVEDEPAIRTLAARVLRGQGYTVLEVPDAEEALGLCPPGTAIDLLLTDIVLPGMRGPALADELRQRVPALRVLLMSGYPDYAARDEHGRETILLKPFTSMHLAAAVRAALEG